MNLFTKIRDFFHNLSPSTRHTLAAIVILSLDAAGAPAQLKAFASAAAALVAPAPAVAVPVPAAVPPELSAVMGAAAQAIAKGK